MKRMLVMLLAVMVSTTSCSFAVIDSMHVSGGHVECTDSLTLPLAELGAGVALIATPFILEATRDRANDDPKTTLSILMWAAGAVATIDSIIGVTKVKKCRRAKEAERLTTPPPAPTP